MRFFISVIFSVFISSCTLYSQQIIKMDSPAIFIKKDNKIEKLIELDRYDGIFEVLETSDYIIFFFGHQSYFYNDNDEKKTLIYRKNDGCFFTFNADGGNGKLLYAINYKSRSFDFFEITTNGEKITVSSVPIPDEADYFWVLNDTFLYSVSYEDRGIKVIYKLTDTTLSKYTECSSDFVISGSPGLFAYNPQYLSNNIMKIVNLSNLKETSIEKGILLSLTKELIFFTNGTSVGYYNKLTDTCYPAEYFIKTEKPEYGGHIFYDYFIQGFEKYPINQIFQINEDQLLLNSHNKICKYSITTGQFEILLDYYTINKNGGNLEMINDNYFFDSNYGISNLISLKEKKIACQFMMNWINNSEPIMDISLMDFYVTRESDVIFYPRYGANETE